MRATASGIHSIVMMRLSFAVISLEFSDRGPRCKPV